MPLIHQPGHCKVCDDAQRDHAARSWSPRHTWGPPEDSDRFVIGPPPLPMRWPLATLVVLALSGTSMVVALVAMGRFVWSGLCPR